jgi:hypothetical protein
MTDMKNMKHNLIKAIQPFMEILTVQFRKNKMPSI